MEKIAERINNGEKFVVRFFDGSVKEGFSAGINGWRVQVRDGDGWFSFSIMDAENGFMKPFQIIFK